MHLPLIQQTFVVAECSRGFVVKRISDRTYKNTVGKYAGRSQADDLWRRMAAPLGVF